MHPLRPLLVAAVIAPLAACTSTYHPEYHPVTVTSYEQHVSGTTLAVPGAAPQAGPVLSAPAPQPPPPPAPWSAWPSQ